MVLTLIVSSEALIHIFQCLSWSAVSSITDGYRSLSDLFFFSQFLHGVTICPQTSPSLASLDALYTGGLSVSICRPLLQSWQWNLYCLGGSGAATSRVSRMTVVPEVVLWKYSMEGGIAPVISPSNSGWLITLVLVDGDGMRLSKAPNYAVLSPLLKSCCWWLLLCMYNLAVFSAPSESVLSSISVFLPSASASSVSVSPACTVLPVPGLHWWSCSSCTLLASWIVKSVGNRQPYAVSWSQGTLPDDFLPVITRDSPPCVTPRVSLAITLTGMGNYKTQESSDPECQGSNQGAGFIDCFRYIRVASFSLLVLLSICLLGSRFYSAFQGWVVPVLSAPTLQCRPRTFPGFGVLWLCTWTWPNRSTRQWLCHCS